MAGVQDVKAAIGEDDFLTVGAGVTRLSLDYQIPIANAIITTENMEQAIARQSDKGTDAARVAVEMANLLDELS